jgi:hypothetical protein
MATMFTQLHAWKSGQGCDQNSVTKTLFCDVPVRRRQWHSSAGVPTCHVFVLLLCVELTCPGKIGPFSDRYEWL